MTETAPDLETLRAELLEAIRRTDDRGLLELLLAQAREASPEADANADGDWWSRLSPERRGRVREALAESAAGAGITSEEMWVRLRNRRA